MKYSVFSVMAPELPFDQLCPLLSQLGYDGIEIRISDQGESEDGSPTFWQSNRANIPATNVLNEIEEVAAICQANNLSMFTLGTYLNPMKGLEETERMMQAANMVGCGQMRIGDGGYDSNGGGYRKQFADCLEVFQEVQKLAKKYKVKVNLESHPNHLVVSASAIYSFVRHFDPEYLGVIYDVGNMVLEGFENYQAGLELLGEYLSFIHIKNCGKKKGEPTPDGETTWEIDLFGEGGTLKGGMVDMRAFIKLIKEMGYDGWLSQEDFSKVKSTREKLTENIEYLRHLEETV